MEVKLVNHQSRKGMNIKNLKKQLWESYSNKKIIDIRTLQLDHIIPYGISLNNSLSNLQLLKPREHREKTIRDRKIIKEFKELGWIEKLTNYSHQLNKPIPFLVKKFKIKTSQVSRVSQQISVNS